MVSKEKIALLEQAGLGYIWDAPKGLIKNRGYKRYLTVEREGIRINLKKVETEKKYDGKYVLTSNTELKAEEMTLAYRELCLPAAGRPACRQTGVKNAQI